MISGHRFRWTHILKSLYFLKCLDYTRKFFFIDKIENSIYFQKDHKVRQKNKKCIETIVTSITCFFLNL